MFKKFIAVLLLIININCSDIRKFDSTKFFKDLSNTISNKSIQAIMDNYSQSDPFYYIYIKEQYDADIRNYSNLKIEFRILDELIGDEIGQLIVAKTKTYEFNDKEYCEIYYEKIYLEKENGEYKISLQTDFEPYSFSYLRNIYGVTGQNKYNFKVKGKLNLLIFSMFVPENLVVEKVKVDSIEVLFEKKGECLIINTRINKRDEKHIEVYYSFRDKNL